ncbi:hypothetical protein ABK040_001490 [Willaertia magna]
MRLFVSLFSEYVNTDNYFHIHDHNLPLVHETIQDIPLQPIQTVIKPIELPNEILKIKHIDCGTTSIRIIDQDGRVYFIPTSNDFPSKKIVRIPFFDGIEKKVLSSSAYVTNALFVVYDKALKQQVLYSQGFNSYGQLYESTETDDSSHVTPEKIPHLKPKLSFQPENPIDNVTHVGCAYSFAVCIVNNVDIHLSGQNWLKETFSTHVWKNKVASVPTGRTVRSLKCGNFHIVIILDDFTLFVGGSNGNGQLPIINTSDYRTCFYHVTSFHAENVYSASDSNFFTSLDKKYFGFGDLDYLGGMRKSETDYYASKELMIPSNLSNKFELKECSFGRDFVLMRLQDEKLKNYLFVKGRAYSGSSVTFNHIFTIDSIAPTTRSGNDKFQTLTISGGPNCIIFLIEENVPSFYLDKLLRRCKDGSLFDLCIVCQQ